MDRDEAIRRAEVAMAWARGEAIQNKRTYSAEWLDIAGPENNYYPSFFDPDREWRIKPKPLECWVYVGDNVAFNAVKNGKRKPTEKPFRTVADGRWVRMVEADD